MALLASYAFDEGSGTTAADLNGGTTLTGIPAWATGRHGTGMRLDQALGPYLDPFGAGSPFTILMDVYIAGSPTNGYHLLLQDDPGGGGVFGNLQLTAGGDIDWYPTIGNSGTLTSATWYNVAITADGTTRRLILDGVQIGSASHSATSGTAPIQIGGQTGYLPNLIIDNVRFYDTALTVSEVAALAGTPVENPPTAIDGYILMESGDRTLFENNDLKVSEDFVGAITASPSGVATAVVLGSPSVSIAGGLTQTASPSGISTGYASGTATANVKQTASPTGIAPPETGSSAPTTFPTAGNTGSTGTLTNNSSQFLGTNGTTYADQNFTDTGTVTIAGDNMTFTNCTFQGHALFSGVDNLLVEDCTFIQAMSVSSSTNTTHRRIKIENYTGDAMHFTSDQGPVESRIMCVNNVVEDSYIYNSNPAPLAHSDGLQVRGSVDFRLRRNTIDTGPEFSELINAAVFFEEDNGGNTGFIVEDNFLKANGFWTAYLNTGSGIVRNNVFGVGGSAGYFFDDGLGGDAVSDGITGSGNVTEARVFLPLHTGDVNSGGSQFGSPTSTITSGSINAQPTGVATAAVLGNPTRTGALTTTAVGIATALAFGSPTRTGALTSSPTGLPTALVFGTTSRTGALQAIASGIDTGQALGNPTSTTLLQASPAATASQEAHGTPTVSLISPAVVAQPSAVASGEVMGLPSLSSLLAVGALAIPTGAALGVPSSSTVLASTPVGVATSAALGNPTLGGVLGVVTGGIATAMGLGAPSVSSLSYSAPTGIGSGQALGVASITTLLGSSPVGVGTGAVIGSPTANAIRNTTPTGVSSLAALGLPTVDFRITAAPQGVVSAVGVGTPYATGLLLASPSGVGSLANIGSPIMSGQVYLVPTSIASVLSMGIPALDTRTTSVLVGIGTGEAWGEPSVAYSAATTGRPGARKPRAAIKPNQSTTRRSNGNNGAWFS